VNSFTFHAHDAQRITLGVRVQFVRGKRTIHGTVITVLPHAFRVRDDTGEQHYVPREHARVLPARPERA